MEQMTIDQLLQQMATEAGSEPEVMKLLAKLKPEAVFEHAKNKNFAMGEGGIPQKYKLLMAIAVSAAIGSSGCTQTYAKVASQKGLSNGEIMEAILMARFVSATTVVNTAADAMRLLVSKADEKGIDRE